MRSKRDIRLAVSVFMAIVLALIIPGLGIAGSLEPPASAVDGLGNPVPTMITPPMWGKKLPASERFEIVFEGEAVLDKETGVVWMQMLPQTTVTWDDALQYCNTLNIGSRSGWRLPTVQELASLIDYSNTNPALPSGHPFTNVNATDGAYWSASTHYVTPPIFAWMVNMGYGYIVGYMKTSKNLSWCVRGGHGVDISY